MKFRNILAGLALMITVGAVAQLDRSKLPEPETPRPIEMGDYESFELKNGLKVYLIENSKLPRVSYSLRFDLDPIVEGEKAGYLGMMGDMLMRGTETRSKEKLDEEIDFIGASITARSSSIFASGLSKYNETILELMTDVLFNPTFPEEELEKIRTQTISGLAQAKESPDAIISNLNSKLVYGSDHPYGEFETEETVANITTADLATHHSKYFKPNVAHLAVVGDIDVKKTKKLIKTYFGSWERGEVGSMTYSTPTSPEKTGVNLVNRSSSVQSVINVTYPVELPQGHPDVIPVMIMNQILGGGGLATKLNMNLREDKAYTYGSYSSLGPDRVATDFTATAEVRNEVTDSAIVQILFEMQQMIDGAITDEEISLAKNAAAGSFSRSLEQPQTIANYAVNQALYGLPENYYSTYIQKVQAVTIDDVKRVSAKYIRPESAHINIVGKASEIADNLSQFGELKYYDVYANEVDPSLAKLPEGLTVEKVLQDYIEAIGGREAISKIKNIKMNMEASIMGQTMTMEMVKAVPNKSFTEVKVGGNTMQKEVFNGESGSATGMQGSQKIEGEAAKDKALEAAIFAELDYLDGKAEVALAGMENIDGTDAYGVEVTYPSGTKVTNYYSVESGLLIRESRTIESPQGAMVMNTDIKEYGEYEGIKLPTLIQQPMGPGMKMDVKAVSVEVNGDISDDLFNE